VGNKRYSNQILCPDFKLNWSVSNFKLLGIDFSLDLSSMPDLNFRKKIIDVSKILKSWQHIKLTLLGKVTVIKTLALPKLIHLLTSLPNLEQALFNDLIKHFLNFIWDGKPEKIKRNTLIADFEDGGLKMIHLQQFNAYLKISWVKKISSNWKGGWEKIMAKKIKYYGGERIFSLQRKRSLKFLKYSVTHFGKMSFIVCT
jgi:hypothetical protein